MAPVAIASHQVKCSWRAGVPHIANELRVSTEEGHLVLDGDFGPDPETGVQWPPFRNFGDKFYTYQLLLDIDPGEGWAIRTEPHPRFHSDWTDTVPIAVPALVPLTAR
jgi:hypothetical protein